MALNRIVDDIVTKITKIKRASDAVHYNGVKYRLIDTQTDDFGIGPFYTQHTNEKRFIWGIHKWGDLNYRISE